MFSATDGLSHDVSFYFPLRWSILCNSKNIQSLKFRWITLCSISMGSNDVSYYKPWSVAEDIQSEGYAMLQQIILFSVW